MRMKHVKLVTLAQGAAPTVVDATARNAPVQTGEGRSLFPSRIRSFSRGGLTTLVAAETVGTNWTRFPENSWVLLAGLALVAQTLLVAVFLHPLSAFVLGNFGFASFL